MSKQSYFTQCDKWRRNFTNGESNWQEMMANRTAIDESEFLDCVDIETSAFLDEDESLEEFMRDDPESGFYASSIKGNVLYFIQTCGFEFIFTTNGDCPP